MKSLLRLYFTILLLNLLIVSCIFFTKVPIKITPSSKTSQDQKCKHQITPHQ